jgi:ATP-dependent protease ClpP protease subunit
MGNIFILALLFGIGLCTRINLERISWANGNYSLSPIQFTIEVLSFLSALYIVATLHWSAKTLSQSKSGLVKLIAYGMLTLQAVLLTSTAINLNFSMKTSSALKEYDDAKISLNGTQIFIEGTIGGNTYEDILKKIKPQNITKITIISPGGLIDEAIKIGKFVKRERIPVHVIDFCASACVIIASSSQRLTATPNSLFGFHQGATIVDSDSSLSKYLSLEATNVMVEALRNNGIPLSILDAAVETKPSEIHYVSAETMLELGVVNEIQP